MARAGAGWRRRRVSASARWSVFLAGAFRLCALRETDVTAWHPVVPAAFLLQVLQGLLKVPPLNRGSSRPYPIYEPFHSALNVCAGQLYCAASRPPQSQCRDAERQHRG